MPAIHLPRLRQEVEDLIQYYAEPEKFQRKLADLFTYYGDLTRRPSQRAIKTPGLPSAKVPQPVLRQVILQLTPYAENAPHAILVLARSLWNIARLEHRQLATLLIGKLPLSYLQDVLLLIPDWCQQNQEETILVSLSTHSLAMIQKEAPDILLEHIETWLDPALTTSEDQSGTVQELDQRELLNFQKLGLSTLVPLVNALDFKNLPKVYTLLKPLLREAPTVLRPYLLDLLRPMARRSPQEIAFILRTELTDHPSKHLVWLARRTLNELPPEHQTKLRALIFPQAKDE